MQQAYHNMHFSHTCISVAQQAIANDVDASKVNNLRH